MEGTVHMNSNILSATHSHKTVFRMGTSEVIAEEMTGPSPIPSTKAWPSLEVIAWSSGHRFISHVPRRQHMSGRLRSSPIRCTLALSGRRGGTPAIRIDLKNAGGSGFSVGPNSYLLHTTASYFVHIPTSTENHYCDLKIRYQRPKIMY